MYIFSIMSIFPIQKNGGKKKKKTQKTHKYLQSITTYLWLYLSTKFQVPSSWILLEGAIFCSIP